MPPSKLLTMDSFVTRSDRLIGNRVDNELVMIDLNSDNYYGLDPIATNIWEQITGPTRVSDLCDKLLEKYAVEKDQCQQDVLIFLEQMSEKGILNVVNESGKGI